MRTSLAILAIVAALTLTTTAAMIPFPIINPSLCQIYDIFGKCTKCLQITQPTKYQEVSVSSGNASPAWFLN